MYASFFFQPSGLIQDTSCDFETVDDVNRKLHSEISSAVQLPIFRYHKVAPLCLTCPFAVRTFPYNLHVLLSQVDLYRECPFWSEDGLCGNRACAVDELDQVCKSQLNSATYPTTHDTPAISEQTERYSGLLAQQ
jgi:hypothetical protein